MFFILHLINNNWSAKCFMLGKFNKYVKFILTLEKKIVSTYFYFFILSKCLGVKLFCCFEAYLCFCFVFILLCCFLQWKINQRWDFCLLAFFSIECYPLVVDVCVLLVYFLFYLLLVCLLSHFSEEYCFFCEEPSAI